MQRFVRHCRLAALIAWLIGFLLGITCYLALENRATGNSMSGFPFRFFAVASLYPALVLVVLHINTRLSWHLVHAHSIWHASLLLAGLVNLLSLFGITEVERPARWLVGLSVALLVLVVEALTKEKAYVQREQYDGWQRLGEVTIVRILLLRVPRRPRQAA